MFGWFRKKEPVAVQEPVYEPPVIPPYGQKFEQFTRFGNTWIDLAKLTAIEFQPPDGCGAELAIDGDNRNWHLSDEDASALRAFLEEKTAAATEDVAVLSRMMEK